MNQESTAESTALPPTKPQGYYCWFKVINVSTKEIVLPAATATSSPSVDVMFPKRPPTLPAGLVPAGSGSWQMDEDNQGKLGTGLRVQYIVVPGSLSEVQAWPYKEEGEGAKWIDGSVTHFLMHFNVV